MTLANHTNNKVVVVLLDFEKAYDRVLLKFSRKRNGETQLPRVMDRDIGMPTVAYH